MIPVSQTRLGGPDAPLEEAGNCYAACVASILELSLDEVPNLTPLDNSEGGWKAGWQKWFRERGLVTYYLSQGEGGALPNAGYTIGTVPSRNGPYEHAVVCLDGDVVWDPNPRNADKSYDPSEVEAWEVFALLDASKFMERVSG